MANIYQYPLKIDRDLMDKLKSIANEEGRSVNKQIEFIIRQFLKSYENGNNQ